MNQTQTMKRTLCLLGAGFCATVGCNEFFQFGIGDDPSTVGNADGASLKQFTSQTELEGYFRDEVRSRNGSLANANPLNGNSAQPVAESDGANSSGGAPTSASGPQAAPGGDSDSSGLAADDGRGGFSQTTTQETGVDEADVVKTDGNLLYVIDDTGENSRLRIVQAVPANSLALLSELDLDGHGREIYLHGNQVIAITAKYGGFIYADYGFGDVIALEDRQFPSDKPDGDGTGTSSAEVDSSVSVDGTTDVVVINDSTPVSSDDGSSTGIIDPGFFYPQPIGFERSSVTVTVVDATNPSEPRVLSKTKFDGSAAANRMVGGVLHLVLANHQYEFFDIMPRLGLPDFDAATVDPATILPKYERINADGTTESGDVLSYADLYRPAEPDGFGVVSVVSMDMNNDADFRATGLVSEPGVVYSSVEALYLTNTDYNFLGAMRTTTDLYKFEYQEGRAVPVAAGRVSGRLLNQYSLGEHNGVLRVATTVDTQFSEDGTFAQANNNVYCLNEVDGALTVMGSIENIAPRETIQSARFVGTKGYVVTFEQIDPLFTLDLSDPANPRIVGELKVPGFSTFIVPMGEDHLLTVGQDVPEAGFGNWGVQLSIFDVKDFANPKLTHKVVLGQDRGAWSEALYDPKAFAYYAVEGLLALPISVSPVYATPVETFPIEIDGTTDRPDEVVVGGDAVVDSDGSTGSGGMDFYQEPELLDPGFEGVVVYRVSATDGFSELGRISTKYDDPGYYSWTSFTRGVFIRENVYAVTNLGVRTAPVASVATIADELFYGTRYPIEGEIEPLPSEVIDIFVLPSGDEDGDTANGGMETVVDSPTKVEEP